MFHPDRIRFQTHYALSPDWNLWNGNGRAGGNAASSRASRYGFRRECLPAHVDHACLAGHFRFPGLQAEHLEPGPDCVIVGNAIPRGNPELEAALNLKLLVSLASGSSKRRIHSRPPLAGGRRDPWKDDYHQHRGLGLDQGGLDPSFLIGGVAQNFGVSFRVTDSDYFIIEGDEYDTAYFDKGPKFMHYLPEIAIVNNIEFDHADIYNDLAAVKLAFRRLMNLVPANGKLIVGWDSPNVREVVASMGQRLFTQVETFGTTSRSQVANIGD